MNGGEWFVVLSGDHAGEVHMRGWMLTALRLVPDGSREYDRMHGWLALAICPRCAALVFADDNHAHGDKKTAHEQWHAATDWPVPAALLEGAVSA